MITAYSYVRFSSKAQELGSSLSRQVNLAKEYAAKNNLYLDNRSFHDLGISAFKGKNAVEGALGAFIKAVDDGIIAKGSYFLVESLDRVSRAEVIDALDTFMGIVKRDIVLVTLQDQQVYTRATITENWTKLIMALAVMARANEESATKAKRIQSAWDGKRTKGKILTSMGPGWLKLNKEKQEWELLPDKVNIVKRVFELAYSGLGAPSIARMLNDEDVPVMGSAEDGWSSGIVAAMMKNSSVIGRYTPKKAKAEPIDGYYPQVILPEVFYTVQENIAKRRGTGGRKGATIANLFSGMFRCECGSKVRYVSSQKDQYYLRCLSAYSNTGCDAPTIPYNVIEQEILFFFCAVEISDMKIGKADTPDETVKLRGEIAERKARLERVMGVIESGGAVSRTISARIVEIEDEIDAFEKKLKDFRPALPMTDALKATHLLYQRLKGENKATWIEDISHTLPADYGEVMARFKEQFFLAESEADEDVIAAAMEKYEIQHPSERWQDEEQLGPKATGEELQTIRAQMQAAFRRIINKIVLLKELHVEDAIPEITLYDFNPETGKEDLPIVCPAEPRRESRNFVVYGPVIDEFKKANKFMWAERITGDGGLPFKYELPGWGINGTRRRSKSKAT